MPTRQGEFRTEIALLRDQLVDAVRMKRLSTLEAGLAIYEDLAEAILDHTETIDRAMAGHPRVSAFGRRYVETAAANRLGVLGEALSPVVEASLAEADGESFWTTMASVGRLAILSWQKRDLASFEEISLLYSRATHRRLHAPEEGLFFVDVPRIAESVSSLWRSTVGLSAGERSWRTASDDDVIAYSEVCLRRHLEIAHQIIDGRTAIILRRWAEVYGQLFDWLELRRNRDSDARLALLARKQAGAVALSAWVLLQWEVEWVDLAREEAAALFDALSPARHSEFTWEALIEDADDRLGRRLGWDIWEGSARPQSQGAYFVAFNGYFDDAALIELSRDGGALARVPSPERFATESDERRRKYGDVARRLLRRVDDLPRYRELGIRIGEKQRSRTALSAIEQAAEHDADMALIARPLNEARVDTFRAAAARAASAADRFALRLPVCQNGAAAGEDQATKAEEEREGEAASAPGDGLFGIARLTPKDFFVESDVYAEPESLGEQFGDAVVRGETELIARRLVAACGHISVEPHAVAATVARGLARIGEPTRHVTVDVFGSYDWWDELRGAALGPAGRYAGYDDPFRFEDAVCYFHPSSDLDIILVADLQRLVCYRRMTPTADEILGDSVGISVTELGIDDARELVEEREPRVADSDLDEEVVRLRKTVRTRVLIHPQLRVLDPSAGIVLLGS